MNIFTNYFLLAVLFAGLMGGVARAQNSKASDKAKDSKLAKAPKEEPGSVINVVAETPGRAEAGAEKDKTKAVKEPGRPERVDPPLKDNAATVIDQRKEDAKEARIKFLANQKELNQRLKDATTEERGRIRNELKNKQSEFLDQIRNINEDIRRRSVDLKENLKDHRDAIDAAREQARDQVKTRKSSD